MTFSLHIEIGTLRHRFLGLWIPDGLHIWIGNRGIHLYWHRPQHGSRVEFDRVAA